MVLAKPTGQNPRALAEKIAAALQRRSGCRLGRGRRPRLRQSQARRRATGMPQLAAHPRRRRRTTAARLIGGGRKVNVEYVSANPTGPMHVGHCRGAVVGDALANLLAFAGYEVTKEYYINDAGAQIDVLARSVDAALPRGAGRDDRRDPGGALSRRLSRPGRPGAGRRSSAGACCRSRRTRRSTSSRTAPSTP